jgi:hypothetical protein
MNINEVMNFSPFRPIFEHFGSNGGIFLEFLAAGTANEWKVSLKLQNGSHDSTLKGQCYITFMQNVYGNLIGLKCHMDVNAEKPYVLFCKQT